MDHRRTPIRLAALAVIACGAALAAPACARSGADSAWWNSGTVDDPAPDAAQPTASIGAAGTAPAVTIPARSATDVPEPGVIGLFAAGLVPIALRMRKARRARRSAR